MAYQARLTAIGLAKELAFLDGGDPIQITHVAVGDQSGTETELSVGQTDLINEVNRASVSSVYTDPDNPLRKIVERAIPVNVGGFWVREASLIDSDGDVVAIANLPPSFKPSPSSGSTRLMLIRLGITVANSGALAEFVIDGSAVYATRDHLDNVISNLPDTWGNSAMLGGQLPSHYATQAALSAVEGNLDAVTDDVSELEQTVNNIPIIPTGTEFGYWGANAPAGYVLASGRTIGSSTSGASERANDDTEALFTLLWSAGTDTTLPIQTSAGGASTRGAGAALDFAAGKRITLPDLRGRVGVGKDDMGGTAAGRMSITLTGTKASTSTGVITGLSSTTGLSVGMTAIGDGISVGATILSIDSSTQVTLSANSLSTGSSSIRFGVLDGATIGASGGTQSHKLTEAQMPAHVHQITSFTNRNTASGGSDEVAEEGSGSVMPTNSAGGDQSHPNVQPSIVRNVIIKL